MRWLILLLASLSLSAQADEADLLVYKIQEPGVENYFSRILVTPTHLRMDEGSDAGGYTLYDRKSGLIYNVDPEDETVIVFEPPREQPMPPESMKLDIRKQTEKNAPRVEGKQPVSIRLLANEKVCRELLVIDNGMKDAIAALRELYKALARVQYPTAYMPGNHMTECELSEFVYAPERAWEHGLPLWDIMGERRRLLVDYRRHQSVPEALFLVPEGYERVVPPPLEGN
ncbi:hypothetical protein [Thiolapillus sp.]